MRKPAFPARLPSLDAGPGLAMNAKSLPDATSVLRGAAPKTAAATQQTGQQAKPDAVRSRAVGQPLTQTPMVSKGAFGGYKPSGSVGLDSAAVRAALVAKLQTLGIRDVRVLRAINAIERHRFVDSALVAQAYEDTSLPIGLGQTISKPSVVSRMIELLLAAPIYQTHAMKPQAPMRKASGRILEIGTGCGYQAAVLAQVFAEVYSIERLKDLHQKARTHLRHVLLPTVQLILGDGMKGFAQGAPYAGIISAAGGESLPEAWLEQLAMGGRIIAPIEQERGRQALVVVDRTSQGYVQQILESVHFVPLKSGIA